MMSIGLMIIGTHTFECEQIEISGSSVSDMNREGTTTPAYLEPFVVQQLSPRDGFVVRAAVGVTVISFCVLISACCFRGAYDVITYTAPTPIPEIE